ncbi:LuxR C-terminal-related transcriptional regulator, partial [Streptomyces sp. NPDC088788]|uniref:LuxR C-terminal-related transcriptional regulator n=1 Tax=Streptomyces sp. NPDC088788 TaxID=3365898 RepID=UPI00380F34EF
WINLTPGRQENHLLSTRPLDIVPLDARAVIINPTGHVHPDALPAYTPSTDLWQTIVDPPTVTHYTGDSPEPETAHNPAPPTHTSPTPTGDQPQQTHTRRLTQPQSEAREKARRFLRVEKGFSDLEMDVFELMADGKSNPEIAQQYNNSETGIRRIATAGAESATRQIYRKLKVPNDTMAIKYAYRIGLSPANEPGTDKLTDKLEESQKLMVGFVADGHSYKKIAEFYGNTTDVAVMNRLREIYKNLNLRGGSPRRKLLAVAYQEKLVSTADDEGRSGNPQEEVSARERQALHLLEQDFNVTWVAAKMSVTTKTVRFYLQRAKEKLGVEGSGPEAVSQMLARLRAEAEGSGQQVGDHFFANPGTILPGDAPSDEFSSQPVSGAEDHGVPVIDIDRVVGDPDNLDGELLAFSYLGFAARVAVWDPAVGKYRLGLLEGELSKPYFTLSVVQAVLSVQHWLEAGPGPDGALDDEAASYVRRWVSAAEGGVDEDAFSGDVLSLDRTLLPAREGWILTDLGARTRLHVPLLAEGAGDLGVDSSTGHVEREMPDAPAHASAQDPELLPDAFYGRLSGDPGDPLGFLEDTEGFTAAGPAGAGVPDTATHLYPPPAYRNTPWEGFGTASSPEEIVVQRIRADDGRTVGKASFVKDDWALREPVYGYLSQATRYRQWSRGPGGERVAQWRSLPATGASGTFFFTSHSGPQGFSVAGADGLPIGADGAMVGRLLGKGLAVAGFSSITVMSCGLDTGQVTGPAARAEMIKHATRRAQAIADSHRLDVYINTGPIAITEGRGEDGKPTADIHLLETADGSPTSFLHIKPILINTLKSKERDLLKLIAQGRTDKEIAEESNVLTNTVVSARHRMYARLGVSGDAGAINLAYRDGLVEPGTKKDRLTDLQREILQHIADGHSNGQIARILGVGLVSLKHHIKTIYNDMGLKLKVRGRKRNYNDHRELLAHAYEECLVEPTAVKQDHRRKYRLSKQEKKVVPLLSENFDYDAVGILMNISSRAVRKHFYEAKSKWARGLRGPEAASYMSARIKAEAEAEEAGRRVGDRASAEPGTILLGDAASDDLSAQSVSGGGVAGLVGVEGVGSAVPADVDVGGDHGVPVIDIERVEGDPDDLDGELLAFSCVGFAARVAVWDPALGKYRLGLLEGELSKPCYTPPMKRAALSVRHWLGAGPGPDGVLDDEAASYVWRWMSAAEGGVDEEVFSGDLSLGGTLLSAAEGWILTDLGARTRLHVPLLAEGAGDLGVDSSTGHVDEEMPDAPAHASAQDPELLSYASDGRPSGDPGDPLGFLEDTEGFTAAGPAGAGIPDTATHLYPQLAYWNTPWEGYKTAFDGVGGGFVSGGGQGGTVGRRDVSAVSPSVTPGAAAVESSDAWGDADAALPAADAGQNASETGMTTHDLAAVPADGKDVAPVSSAAVGSS